MHQWTDVISRAQQGNPAPDRRIEKTPDEWRKQLTAEQFRVTRLAGTERAFSSAMCSLFEPGRYRCVCCGTELFDAANKFESGTGVTWTRAWSAAASSAPSSVSPAGRPSRRCRWP